MKSDKRVAVLCGIVVLLVVSNLLSIIYLADRACDAEKQIKQAKVDAPTIDTAEQLKDDDYPLAQFKVINGHDHLYKEKHLQKYFEAAKDLGIAKTMFVASSGFTLMGKAGKKSELNDWNSAEIMRCARKYPGKIIPFCTIYPGDPDKLEKVKKFVADGFAGLKLYSGHSAFYDKPLDASDMMEVYEYCESVGFPICWHIRLTSNRFAGEFTKVMEAYPQLKVVIPHFGVTFYRPTAKPWYRLQQMMDKYPNLYTDTSFGTRAILVHGMEVVSKNPQVFRDFFKKYGDRVIFGTDMVVTGNSEKTVEWIGGVLRACRDMLEKDEYHFSMAASPSPYAYKPANNTYGKLRGLSLDEDALRKVYETNFEQFMAIEPAPNPEWMK